MLGNLYEICFTIPVYPELNPWDRLHFFISVLSNFIHFRFGLPFFLEEAINLRKKKKKTFLHRCCSWPV